MATTKQELIDAWKQGDKNCTTTFVEGKEIHLQLRGMIIHGTPSQRHPTSPAEKTNNMTETSLSPNSKNIQKTPWRSCSK
jgi:hypothetical protein